MSALEDEIDANFATFRSDWTKQARDNWSELSKLPIYAESYRRIACVNALKNDLIAPHLSAGSAAFFYEAHNDALVSHVNASTGAWRSALQALRSTLENTLAAIYFKDHPIELALWTKGKFRLGFTELHKYASSHPDIADVKLDLAGLATIHEEYATLSKAVHASAATFRMTGTAAEVLLWDTDKAKASMWATRERKVLEGVSLLLVCLFADRLKGTALPGLRTALSFTIPPKRRAEIKTTLNISITKA